MTGSTFTFSPLTSGLAEIMNNEKTCFSPPCIAIILSFLTIFAFMGSDLTGSTTFITTGTESLSAGIFFTFGTTVTKGVALIEAWASAYFLSA